MTDEQIEICSAFHYVVFDSLLTKVIAVNLYNKSIHKPKYELSESQNEFIFMILYEYRRQMPALYEKYKDNEFCKQLKK